VFGADADEVVPLNVHSSVLPPFVNEHVSDSVSPWTPRLAIGPLCRITESTAEAETPPYDPVIVSASVDATLRVLTANDPVVEPAGITTDAGTVAALPPVSDTDAPPAGAGNVSDAVPVTAAPPMTLAVLNEIVDSTDAAGGTTTTGVTGLGAIVEPQCTVAIEAISTAASRVRPPRVIVFIFTSCSS